MFNKKKKYFKKKLNGVKCMTWDLEFKRAKTAQIREDIRREYDGVSARLHIIDTQIKALPEDRKNWTDEQKRLDDQKVLLEKDKENYISQMKGLDVEINGSQKTNEFPEGYNGINQQLEALRELQTMLREFIKTL